MKRINIISEAIYKGKHKLVNQGAFINISDLVSDIFRCFNISCCNEAFQSQSDFFIKKAYVRYGRKKPGANWQSLDKLVLNIYNCFTGTTLCPSRLSEQWWITTDIIRPAKTIETINFTPIIEKVLDCCGIINVCTPLNFRAYADEWALAGVSSQADLLALLVAMGNTTPVISNYAKQNEYLAATISGVDTLDFTFLSNPNLFAITELPAEINYIDVSGQGFSEDGLNLLAELFLDQGILPKDTWNSSSQQTSAQPSPTYQSALTADVTNVTF
jgi:hypothetical protein